MDSKLKETHKQRRRVQTRRQYLPPGLIVWGVVATIAVLANYRYAEAQTDAPKAKVQSPTPQQPQAIQPAKPSTKAAAEGGGGCGDKSTAGAQPVKVTEGAKWVCEKTQITHDGIWRGQPIVCDFVMRNDGTEDLTFTAKGG